MAECIEMANNSLEELVGDRQGTSNQKHNRKCG